MNRRWVKANYPNKEWLSEREAMGVLRNGPDLAWFKGWAEHGVLMPAGATGQAFRCGYVHVCGGYEEPAIYDVHLFYDREGLAWALEVLYSRHPNHTVDCQLWYFTRDEPLRLRMVVELDDEDDAEPEAAK
jgi:hypothetical protein